MYKKIEHKFLLRGHTHLEVDCVHAVIERMKKQMPDFRINVPLDYENFIRTISIAKKKLIVRHMGLDDFLDFKALKEHYLPARLTMSAVVHFKFVKRDPYTLFYKTSFDQEEFFTCDIRRYLIQ